VKDFRNLKVWEKSHALTLQIYRQTDRFPKREMFGITSQLRRASASIAANVAEACGRLAKGDFSRFLSNATGSASEVEYFLVLCRDLNLFTPDVHATCNREVVEVKRMLAALITKVEMQRHAN
jgi:four helix bundle protein